MSRPPDPARQTSSPGPPHQSQLQLRLVVLGVTAMVLVWTGHDVTWELLGRTGSLWLLDSAPPLAVVASLVVLRAVTSHWAVAAIAVGLLVALLD